MATNQVVGYVRVSTEEQGISGAGLEAQRRAIRAEASRREWQLEAIETDVVSGRSLKNRPGLARALALCRTGEVDGVVVAKLDRLSRSLIDFAGLIQEAQTGRFNIVALDLGVDLSTPSGEFLANVMASAAQWERRIIGERTRDALASRRAAGVRLGRPPQGEDPISKRIKKMRAAGTTLQAISDNLNRQGVPTFRGGTEWRPSSVRAVLNRVAA
jgi:DNA invertase Pin-like site-specific DNA recombinase